MKISINQLGNYIDLPDDTPALHALMEDIGLEVKRVDTSGGQVVFNLELLANRGDHHSYRGIATELHGRTGWKLKPVEVSSLPHEENASRVDVQTDNCLNYTLTEYKKDGSQPERELTEEQKNMVTLSGNNTVIPVVDITNFISIEIGQPLHVFDADKVDGTIVVRETVAGEKAKLLFSEIEKELPEGTIVIADQSKILAVAGVMGCEDCKPTAETTRVYLESATFDPVKVRKAAKALSIQSTASQRFERGGDVDLALAGAKRAAAMMTKMGWNNEGNIQVAKTWQYTPAVIELDMAKLNNYFDTQFSSDQVSTILSRYGFGVANDNQVLHITVPSSRMWDVKTAKDLYEEVARSVGYDSLPSSLPTSASGVLPSSVLQRKKDVSELLVGKGFYEVFTDGFYGEQHRANTGISEGHLLWNHVKTVNAEDRSFSFLKNNTLAQACELVQTNAHAKNPNIKAYEWTRTFHPNGSAENGLCEERLVLWALASGESSTSSWNDPGKKVDIFYMKGIVEELSNMLGIQLQVRQSVSEEDIPAVGTCLHPTRRGAIYFKDKMIGVLGEVHPNVLSGWGIKNARPCFIELSQEILTELSSERKYTPPSNLHPVIRDVCLLIPNGVAAGEIATYMQGQSPWLKSVKITDVFNSEVTNNRNAVTFSLEYSLEKANKSSFTIEDINEATEKIVSGTLDAYKAYALERR